MTKELAHIVSQLARADGYARRYGLFYFSNDDLTGGIHLQSSQWCDGVYTNIGILPTKVIPLPTKPPAIEYWPLSGRADRLNGPFKDLFSKLAESAALISAHDAQQMFPWLLQWMRDAIQDTEGLRKAILHRRNHSYISQICDLPTEWMMADWANDKLRSWEYYYPIQ